MLHHYYYYQYLNFVHRQSMLDLNASPQEDGSFLYFVHFSTFMFSISRVVHVFLLMDKNRISTLLSGGETMEIVKVCMVTASSITTLVS